MFTQFAGIVATVYGVLGALKALLQTRQMLAHRSSGEVSARFLASCTGVTRSGWPTGSAPAVSRSSSWTLSACSAEG